MSNLTLDLTDRERQALADALDWLLNSSKGRESYVVPGGNLTPSYAAGRDRAALTEILREIA